MPLSAWVQLDIYCLLFINRQNGSIRCWSVLNDPGRGDKTCCDTGDPWYID